MKERARAPRRIAVAAAAALAVLIAWGASGPAANAAVSVTKTPQVNCKQLTKAQIQPLLSAPIATVKVTKAGIAGQQCVFGSDAGGAAIDVLVDKGSFAKRGYDEEVKGYSNKVAVRGVTGANAYRDTGDFQVVALKGDTYCSVSVGSSDSIPGVGAIEAANNGSSNLPEKDNDVIATALGTICNRIYRSGNTTPSLDGLS